MENPPERRDPASGLRASDSNREQVAGLLGEALSTGQLSHDEYSERLDSLYAAKTLGELEVITRDLQLEPRSAPSAVPYEPTRDGADTDHLLAVFSGSSRKGRWRVRRRIRGLAMFGGLELDLTDAVFESREVEITVFAMFGGADIRVPDGVEVRCQGMGIFGGFDVHGGPTIDPAAPVVVVKGLAIFGGVGGKPRKNRKRDSGA
ncbi:DUF1707 SHOCT-like domain-containing protein [Streptosporangium sp. KLBMP 9127]|nr:DUF1707 domain-containing protein [Streptosporangium sp. KLBMP 9127]